MASNSYRVRSVMDGRTYIYPGDHLVKVRGYNSDSLKRLVTSMVMAAERNTASIGRRQTRSRAIRQVKVPLFATKDRRDDDSCYDLEGACIWSSALL